MKKKQGEGWYLVVVSLVFIKISKRKSTQFPCGWLTGLYWKPIKPWFHLISDFYLKVIEYYEYNGEDFPPVWAPLGAGRGVGCYIAYYSSLILWASLCWSWPKVSESSLRVALTYASNMSLKDQTVTEDGYKGVPSSSWSNMPPISSAVLWPLTCLITQKSAWKGLMLLQQLSLEFSQW